MASFMAFTERQLNKKTVRYLVLFVMILFFLASRIYRIGRLPNGIQIDELGSAFDAQAIAQFGVDRYLTQMPPYFKNYGGGQSALYTYSAAIFFLLTDFSLSKFRLIAVAYAFAGLLCLYDLTRKVFGGYVAAFFSCFLYTICPVFLMSQRWGLDCYLFLSMSFVAVYFLFIAHERKNAAWYVLTGILFGITLYTYAISYLVIPLFLIVVFLYLLYLKGINWKRIIAFSIPLGLLGFPLVIEQMVNKGLLPPMRLLWSDYFPMEWYRGNEFGFGNVFGNLTRFWILFSHDDLHHNANPVFGTMYYVSVPFIFVGAVLCGMKAYGALKEKKFDFSVVLISYAMSSLFVTLILREININRCNELYFSFLLFTVYSIDALHRRAQWTLLPLFLIYLISFLVFAGYYYHGGYNQDLDEGDLSFLFQEDELGRAVQWMEKSFGKDHIIGILANEGADHHFQVACYAGTSPYEYREDDESSWIKENNYEIGVPEELDLSGRTVYIIGQELHHITDYLASCGFFVDDASIERFSLVYLNP